MGNKKIELPDAIRPFEVLEVLVNSQDNPEKTARLRKSIEEFIERYPEANSEANKIIKLLGQKPAFLNFLELKNVDGLTVFCLVEQIARDVASYAIKQEKSKGGKQRAKNNPASKALYKIANMDWPSHPKRLLIIDGKHGYKQAFIDEMAGKYPEIERIESIDELVTNLKKKAKKLNPVI